MESAPHPKQQLWVDLGGMAEPQDILRREDESAGFVKVRLDGHQEDDRWFGF
ncbi:MAG: hypothetical protein ACLR8P_11850 [Clostridium fessum]